MAQDEKPEGDDPEKALKDLGSRLQDARAERQPVTSGSAEGNMMGLAYRMLADILAGIGVGGYLGWWLDTQFDTQPVLFVFMLFLGMAGGVANSVRSAARAQRANQRRENKD